jgi:Tfp pilus assembly protein PilF
MSERPRDPAPRLEAAQIMLRNGQETEALYWFQLALQLDPTHRSTHRALAEFWDSKGETKRAADHRQMAGQP